MMKPPTVTIYTKKACPYCVRAKDYFKRSGIVFHEADLTDRFEDIKALKDRTGHMTFPQIFFGDEFIGGYDDLMRRVESASLT